MAVRMLLLLHRWKYIPMLRELKFQVSTAVLTVITIAAIVAAVLNFGLLEKFRLANDGVTWIDRGGSVIADRVDSRGGGQFGGIRPGDILRTINGGNVRNAIDVPKILAGVVLWTKADYEVTRNGVLLPAKVIVGEVTRDVAVRYQYLIGATYLCIGLFIYFRRGSAQKAQHFYIFCLVSFIFFCFHHSGKLNAFDKVVYVCNVIAGWLAPTLFLHFCLTFPEPRGWFRRGYIPLVYAPGVAFTAIFLGITSGVIHTSVPLVQTAWYLDRVWMALLTVLYLVSGLTLALEYRRTEDVILRQQLKWLRNGTFCGFLPFALFYATPYILGGVPGPYLRLSVLTLVLIPLTIAYAIVRYRLMDVDIIFRRGYAYTLATLCILAAFYGLVFGLGSVLKLGGVGGSAGPVAVMLLAAFLFQPLRNWMQERIDKYFYREQYDYRRTLIEFARELNSEIDLDKMLASVADRLMQTLSIRQIGFFLESEGGYRLRKLAGSQSRSGSQSPTDAESLDLSFLNWERPTPYIFFERTRYRLDALAQSWQPSVRNTIADLDLTYYIPCSSRGRTIAFIGVSRTEAGEYLSSDDLELLATLSGYVGLAVENAGLYRSLQRKVDDYERLKEFSENIVESINVGILAADLEDRVESWNTRMEELTGVARETAVGQRLVNVLPPSLMDHLDRLHGDMSIHHLDKIPLPFTRRTDGREITVNIAVAPLVSRDMQQIGRLVIFDDITDRADLERRLVQADKLSSIGLLAAGVAHEVNTPLAVISTYAQMLTKQVSGDEQKSRMLEKISKQTFRASEIVNSLLNFSRTSTTELTQVSLNKVIGETLSLLEHQFKSAHITIQNEVDGSLPPVTGNAGKLQQVFLNLFINARDAMQPGGVLTIDARYDGFSLQVDIADTGHGIAPEHLNRIYDPFFTTKAARKGTGLGLSVSYGIIQEHGGNIEVFSRPEGGTRFRLELPRARKGTGEPLIQKVVNA